MRRRKERVKTELSEIKININFENLIPKQTAEQFKQLEENMVAEGRARNPLVLWNNTLVDGQTWVIEMPLAEWHSTGGKEKGIALADDNTAGAERQGKYGKKVDCLQGL